MSRNARTVVLPLVVVLVVGVMAWLLFWPRSTTGTAGSEAAAGPYLVRLVTDTVSIGDALVVTVTDGTGRPAEPESVQIEPVMTQMGHALPPVVATASEPGSYQAQVDFFMVGQWGITVRITSGNQMSGDHQMDDAVLLLTVVG